MQYITAVVVLVTCAAKVRGQRADPCDPNSYVEINDPYRSTGYEASLSEVPKCDIHLRRGWYRFTSGVGQEMPTSCVERMKCGTIVPIWMRGQHPSVADGVSMREACGNFNRGDTSSDPCCEHKLDIAVKNCSGYYVYLLSPTPSCPMLYCAGEKTPCPAGMWSATGFNSTNSPCKRQYPTVSNSPVFRGPHIHNKSFEFTCDINFSDLDPDQRFEVAWTFNGREDASVPPSVLRDPIRTASLDGAFLRNHMGSSVGCKVRAFYEGNYANAGLFLHSNTYYAGVRLSPARITLSESSLEQNITIRSSIPVMCDHEWECCITFKLDTDATEEFSVASQCDYKLCDTHWDHSTRSASIEVAMIANQDMVDDGEKQSLLVTFETLLAVGGGKYQQVFDGHLPTQIHVNVEDTSTSYCRLTSDPHVHTYDRYHYFLSETGDVLATEITSRDFQVMVRNWMCGSATCICGVAIREKNDVIVISQCDQAYTGGLLSPTVTKDSEFSDGVIVERSDREIGVYLGSGVEVRVGIFRDHLDVDLTLPGTYRNQAVGLCGTNDGDRGNDCPMPDGSFCRSSRCLNQFMKSWRVPLDRSLFERFPPAVPSDKDVEYCACKDNHHGSPAIDCSFRENKRPTGNACNRCNDITATVPLALPGVGNNRRRRAATFGDHDEPDPGYVHVEFPPFDPANLTWPNAQGLTQAQARDMCKKAIDKSQLSTKCDSTDPSLRSELMEDCVFDIQISGSTKFLESATDSFTRSCQMELSRDPANYVTSPTTGRKTLMPEYRDDICSSQCLEHGICAARGVCLCETGWEGPNCHIESGKGPILHNIRSGPLCDLSDRPCEKIYLDVTNMQLSDRLACRVQAVDENANPVGKPAVTEAVFLTSYRVSCVVPKTHVSSQRYSVSATNDGSLFGNALTLQVFDSTCIDCSSSGCVEKPTACHIEHKCYQNEAVHVSDRNKVCDVSTNTTEWTHRPSLPFTPSLSGPISDKMTCHYTPTSDVSGKASLTWLVDGQPVATSEIFLSSQPSEGTISASLLPTSGKLTCEVGFGIAASKSGSIDLAFIRH